MDPDPEPDISATHDQATPLPPAAAVASMPLEGATAQTQSSSVHSAESAVTRSSTAELAVQTEPGSAVPCSKATAPESCIRLNSKSTTEQVLSSHLLAVEHTHGSGSLDHQHHHHHHSDEEDADLLSTDTQLHTLIHLDDDSDSDDAPLGEAAPRTRHCIDFLELHSSYGLDICAKAGQLTLEPSKQLAHDRFCTTVGASAMNVRSLLLSMEQEEGGFAALRKRRQSSGVAFGWRVVNGALRDISYIEGVVKGATKRPEYLPPSSTEEPTPELLAHRAVCSLEPDYICESYAALLGANCGLSAGQVLQANMTGFDHFHTLLEVRQGKMRRMKTLIGTLHNETARVKQLLENLEFAKKKRRLKMPLLMARETQLMGDVERLDQSMKVGFEWCQKLRSYSAQVVSSFDRVLKETARLSQGGVESIRQTLGRRARVEVSAPRSAVNHTPTTSAVLDGARATEAHSKTVIKEGWITKKGDLRRKWKQRYIVLHDDYTLYYYTDEKKQSLKGVINLRNASEVGTRAAASDLKRLSFFIRTKDRTFYFSCASPHSRNDWLTVLRRYLPFAEDDTELLE